MIGPRPAPDTLPRPRTWATSAACHGHDPALWDADGINDALDHDRLGQARAICASCPIKVQCLKDAVDTERAARTHERTGIRGGYTPEERRMAYLRYVAPRRAPKAAA